MGVIFAQLYGMYMKEKCGILMPGDTDEKTGDLVCDTLKQKNIEGRYVVVENLLLFDSYPEKIQIEVTDENVESVAKKMSGSAGPSGTDPISMSHCLLIFAGTSEKIRESIDRLVG